MHGGKIFIANTQARHNKNLSPMQSQNLMRKNLITNHYVKQPHPLQRVGKRNDWEQYN